MGAAILRCATGPRHAVNKAVHPGHRQPRRAAPATANITIATCHRPAASCVPLPGLPSILRQGRQVDHDGVGGGQ